MQYIISASVVLTLDFVFDTEDYPDDIGTEEGQIKPDNKEDISDYIHDNLLLNDEELDGLMSGNGYSVDQADILTTTQKQES